MSIDRTYDEHDRIRGAGQAWWRLLHDAGDKQAGRLAKASYLIPSRAISGIIVPDWGKHEVFQLFVDILAGQRQNRSASTRDASRFPGGLAVADG
jgi:hypothetical protein